MLITSPRMWRDCTDVDASSGQTAAAFIVADLPLAIEQAKPCKCRRYDHQDIPGVYLLIPAVWMCTVTATSTTPSRSQHQADISAGLKCRWCRVHDSIRGPPYS